MPQTLNLEEIDLTDPDFFRDGDPHGAFRLLRREAPVYWHDRGDGLEFWAITKHEDIIRISRDPDRFVSGQGVVMGDELMDMTEKLGYDFRGSMLLMSDPPNHTRLRQMVSGEFKRSQLTKLQHHIREIVDAIIADVVERGECDFVADVAARLPLAVICEMMDLPRDEWQHMFELGNRMIGASDPEYNPAIDPADPLSALSDASMDFLLNTQMEMFMVFAQLAEEKRKAGLEGHNDLVSVLLGSELTQEELLIFCLLLVIAGNETTRNATSAGMLALIEHPDQRQRLVDDPSLLDSGVEEILRWTSPVMHFKRVATQDVELRGQRIREGDRVVMWYPSANRDEDVFVDPYRFDVGRHPNDHLAFGRGEHFCLGANLARLELRVMFSELLRLVPDMELASPAERLRSNFIGGVKQMPVTFTPTAVG